MGRVQYIDLPTKHFKRTLSVFCLLMLALSVPRSVFAAPANTLGRIVLDVEQNGEAWYVNPLDERRYYLGRPDDAFSIMRGFGLGISNADLSRFDSDTSMQRRLSGRILLQVESHGEAYYVNPVDLKKYYLGRPADAFAIMSNLGLGISSHDLRTIPTGSYVSRVYQAVPFAPQAPFGDWSDERQQEGCEEASVAMAMAWVRGEDLSASDALEQILAMSDWEKEQFGYYVDTSAQDTATRLFNRWFDYQNVYVERNVSAADVLDQLESGRILVVPIDGQEVNHPYYTPPGPARHMIVVHGYDYATNMFYYHDPGTQYGGDLTASAEELNTMMRDYTSGVHEPIGAGDTAMIVVRK